MINIPAQKLIQSVSLQKASIQLSPNLMNEKEEEDIDLKTTPPSLRESNPWDEDQFPPDAEQESED